MENFILCAVHKLSRLSKTCKSQFNFVTYSKHPRQVVWGLLDGHDKERKSVNAFASLVSVSWLLVCHTVNWLVSRLHTWFTGWLVGWWVGGWVGRLVIWLISQLAFWFVSRLVGCSHRQSVSQSIDQLVGCR